MRYRTHRGEASDSDVAAIRRSLAPRPSARAYLPPPPGQERPRPAVGGGTDEPLGMDGPLPSSPPSQFESAWTGEG